MEKIVLDSAIKFGAGRYRQGAGILAEAGTEIGRFSKKAFFVSGPRAWAALALHGEIVAVGLFALLHEAVYKMV